MSQVRYYVDEHIARAVVNGLRRRGIDVVMPAEVAMLGHSDPHQLAFAAANGRVIVTKDQDFLRPMTPVKSMLALSSFRPIRS